MNKSYLSIAMAYVGVLVGAGLSSGQDLLQYFLSFGRMGLLGVLLLGLMNIIFGRIIITLGSHFQSDSHQDVLVKITYPWVGRLIDVTLIISCFVVGFVMVAGAGANLEQQFAIPAWLGALSCSLLVVMISFFDIERITQVLGIFTPVIVVMILLVAGYTLFQQGIDLEALDQAALEMKPVMPNVWFSVVNYYALCAMNGVSMAFVLGGSVLRIGDAEKGGAAGGCIIGLIITCAALAIAANLPAVKDTQIPMLMIVNNIHHIFGWIYAVVIFALIFNTAFSLYYATARRLAGSNVKKMRLYLLFLVTVGYVCSFGGFTSLVSYMYPILGYLGILLLIVLAFAWWKERESILLEKLLRRKMIRLLLRKYNDDVPFDKKHKEAFHKLGEISAADTENLKEDIKSYVKEVAENHEDLTGYVEENLPVDHEKLKDLLAKKEENDNEEVK